MPICFAILSANCYTFIRSTVTQSRRLLGEARGSPVCHKAASSEHLFQQLPWVSRYSFFGPPLSEDQSFLLMSSPHSLASPKDTRESQYWLQWLSARQSAHLRCNPGVSVYFEGNGIPLQILLSFQVQLFFTVGRLEPYSQLPQDMIMSSEQIKHALFCCCCCC